MDSYIREYSLVYALVQCRRFFSSRSVVYGRYAWEQNITSAFSKELIFGRSFK